MQVSGYHRKHAIRLLRDQGPSHERIPREPSRRYGDDVRSLSTREDCDETSSLASPWCETLGSALRSHHSHHRELIIAATMLTRVALGDLRALQYERAHRGGGHDEPIP